jgi:hypothetical protein
LDNHDGQVRTIVDERVGTGTPSHFFLGRSLCAYEIDHVMDVMDPAGLLVVNNAGIVRVDALAIVDPRAG